MNKGYPRRKRFRWMREIGPLNARTTGGWGKEDIHLRPTSTTHSLPMSPFLLNDFSCPGAFWYRQTGQGAVESITAGNVYRYCIEQNSFHPVCITDVRHSAISACTCTIFGKPTTVFVNVLVVARMVVRVFVVHGHSCIKCLLSQEARTRRDATAGVTQGGRRRRDY